MTISRRSLLLAAPAVLSGSPESPLIDTHIHLFEPERFPYHAKASYRPPAEPLDRYAAFVRKAGIDGAVVVHPEPYQDDHRYLEYCFANEPKPGFFRGTCLFDPILPDTPARMEALVKRNPGRIVGLRIHVNRPAGTPATTSGPIRDRDLAHPGVRAAWRKAQDLGIAVQMHFIPVHARDIASLAREFPRVHVVLDHLARSGQGTPEQYNDVLAMGKLPNVYMKFSGVGYSSREKSPFADVKPLVRRTFDAFGPDRMIWGGLGMNLEDFRRNNQMFAAMFDFASASDRAKIRGITAARLFGFRNAIQ